jgi:acyl-CoA dehydrogenase
VTAAASPRAVPDLLGDAVVVAERCADEVDAQARFPVEAFAELRRAGALGALVPSEWGGGGATVTDVSGLVRMLAGACGSSALIFAMHQIQVSMVIRHATAAAQDQLLPRIARGEVLLANAASETGLAGNQRASQCALTPAPGGASLRKEASTVSFGEYADGILVTARRAPDAEPGDQVMAICLPPSLTVEPQGDWDTLGMRGTVSRPCRLTAVVPPELVIADYPSASLRTTIPVSAVLLSSVWVGLAEAAGQRAHAFVRQAGRRAAGAPVPAALRLSELSVLLDQLRAILAAAASRYELTRDDPDEPRTFGFAAAMGNVKVATSTLTIDVVNRAMAICGLAGYASRGPFSIGRIMRDAAAGPLMISNDRVLNASARALLVRKSL